MKIFSELCFKGTENQLLEFTNDIKRYVTGNWTLKKQNSPYEDYLMFNYNGTSVDKACVSIYFGDLSTNIISVGNIVPAIKSSLSICEYNKVLIKFYDDIIQPYETDGTSLTILGPSSDSFEPLSIITPSALNKLKSFCNHANKSTGSAHPSDREKWFDFICETVDDDKIFTYDVLASFLQDEDYWGEKADDFIGVIGNFAWDERHAYELADEYVNSCEILKHYKKTKGV